MSMRETISSRHVFSYISGQRGGCAAGPRWYSTQELSPEFSKMYSKVGRPSTAGAVVARFALDAVLGAHDAADGDRLQFIPLVRRANLDDGVGRLFTPQPFAGPPRWRWLSATENRVPRTSTSGDGSLLEAWASAKGAEQKVHIHRGSGNPGDYRGRSVNETHESKAIPKRNWRAKGKRRSTAGRW